LKRQILYSASQVFDTYIQYLSTYIFTDLGRLLVIDYNEFEENQFKSNTDEYISNLTRDNVQLLVNDIWQVSLKKKDEKKMCNI
jgi:hypothetical protein